MPGAGGGLGRTEQRSPGRFRRHPWPMRSMRAGQCRDREEAECVPVGATDIAGLIGLCRRERIDFVVVGPEAPLVLGLVDALEAEGIPAFGPNAAAAVLEGSKAYTKDLCARAGIPAAASRRFPRFGRGQGLYSRAMGRRSSSRPTGSAGWQGCHGRGRSRYCLRRGRCGIGRAPVRHGPAPRSSSRTFLRAKRRASMPS